MFKAARFVALAIVITSCANDTGTVADTSRADTSIVVDTRVDSDVSDTYVPGDVIDFDTRPVDTGTPDAAPGGDFGAACAGNEDCESGWCVEGPQGYVCTKECLETCPEDFDCKSVQNAKGDVTFLCLPRVRKNCVPCLEDFQCNGGACLTIDAANQCAAGCDELADCPQGYACMADPLGARSGLFCQPKSGSCECSQAFDGVRRTCTTANELGVCYGVETCDPEFGWVGCNAHEAVPELCDYLDNDCDGDVDEDFKAEGIYASVDGCGSCTTRCDDVLANATETECRVEGALARCRVVSCEGGFNLVNPFVCAPDVGNFCQPCDDETLCIGTGAACTELSDGRYCTRGCVHDANCPQGFACRNSENGLQCVPTSGSCTCDGTNLNLARACSRTLQPTNPEDPVVTCKGFEACTPDGWGECGLPDDHCDGTDNDCDGVVDGPYKTDGKYSAIEHCGACEISCAVLVRPNSVPSCDISGAVPTCGIACVEGAVDVNGEGNDGCECIFQPGDDLAGDDEDSNCDGVDGEVDNATFVSKEGDNNNPGTRELPVRTIQRGIERSEEGGLRDVYVATGVYSENILIADGVGVFGGYAPAFDDHEVSLYETAIVGNDADATHFGTVTAVAVGVASATRDTVFDGFTVFGINAGNTQGGTSYGIYVRNAGARLRVSNNRVFGGPGGNGRNGTRGGDGLNGTEGSAGLQAKNLLAACQPANESNGGTGGLRVCADLIELSGGDGGRAFCPHYESPLPDGARGRAGKGPGGAPGGVQAWPLMICANNLNDRCSTFNCGACRLPSGGKPYNARDGNNGGVGINGVGGTGGPANGLGTSGFWVGNNGGSGFTGSNGGGGGGGGAAGGVEVVGAQCPEVGDDDVGGSGGGAGSGGCLGSGGTGGGSGGGSFGIFVVGTSSSDRPIIKGNWIEPGRGGNGGFGGAGGVGGAGGRGGRGGGAGDTIADTTQRDRARCSQGGGNGGNGGNGGHGGGGGGGAGGPSYALFVSMPGVLPTLWRTDNFFYLGGEGGAGGPGGVSVDQTRSGANGANGISANTNF